VEFKDFKITDFKQAYKLSVINILEIVMYFCTLMILIYNLSIIFIRLGVRFAALFHPKAKAFVTGRKGLLKKIEDYFRNNERKVVWIHCASLGEFEQGKPIIESIKQEFPQTLILLTFFSPSGYEIRKNYKNADLVTYLPLDTARNAEKFVSLVKPSIAIFVKYEFWYHYSRVLKDKGIPILSISSIFRKDQLFFQGMGSFSRSILKNFSHFFVQNHESITLLARIGLTNVTLAGDTRFDRVYQIVQNNEPIAIAAAFKGDQKVMVIGSSWQEDMEVLIPFINENKLKFIIAPHEITPANVSNIEKALQVKSIRYSEAQGKNLDEFSVLIIDNIGLLSRLYRYGEFAYVGGAFGKGLHNILEAACYGVPVFFGNRNYEKFQEAVHLINRGGAFEVRDYPDLKDKYEMLNMPASFLLACEVTRQYVEENLGATEKIMAYCRQLIISPPAARA
jgi:3-deoxy-D-manno-octulosonic-acid transferase